MTRVVALVAALLLLAAPAAALAATPRTTLGDVEDEVMCPVCGTPLSVAESPQANRERDFIAAEVAQGKSKARIKRDLVAQYGPNVLALPDSNDGVNWAVYVVPAVLALAALAALAIFVPRWRRRAPDGPDAKPRASLTDEDEQRVDRELAGLD
jgi:cytochrome c-type biogenesis protein CcmH/NrfF